MHTRTFTYKNWNDEEVTETFYFNLSMPELIELSVEFPGGLHGYMQSIMEAGDKQTLIAVFKKLLLLSYGEKTADGKHFNKNDELRERFAATVPYTILYMELALDSKKAAEFLEGIVPKDLEKYMKELEAAQAAEGT